VKIVKKRKFLNSLQNIIMYIAEDKPSAAVNFYLDLNKKIETLTDNSKRCRKSLYHENDSYRDMIFEGYTVVYKISKHAITILDIFKWQKK
jgi:plasmid stabilization system protein ParE